MRLEESDDFIAIKSSFIDRLIVAILMLLSLALIGSFYRMTEVGFQPGMAVHILISIIFLAVYLCRRNLNHRTKGAVIVGTLFLAGTVGLLNFGLVGAGTIVLLASVVIACLVLSTRAAIVVIAVGGLLQVSYLAYIALGDYSPAISLSAYAFSTPAWINNLFAYIVLSGIFIFVIGNFFTYLQTVSSVLQHAVEEKHKELEHSSAVADGYQFIALWNVLGRRKS